MLKQSFIGILLLSLTLLQVNNQQTPQTSNTGTKIPQGTTFGVNRLIKGSTQDVDQGRAFHKMDIGSLQKKFLFFRLNVDPIFRHLNITMMFYREGESKPFHVCSKIELDSCYISAYQLKLPQSQTLSILISTEQSCEYSLFAYWSDLEHIELDKEYEFIFSETEQRQLYHLELEGKQFEELRIIIKPETRRYPFDQVKMYGKYGNNAEPTAEDYDFKSTYLWEDAEGIYLFKNEMKAKNMVLILYGTTKVIYKMKCTIVNKTHNDIVLNSKIYQYFEPLEEYTYHLIWNQSQTKAIQSNNKKDNKSDEVAQFQYVSRIATFTGDLQVNFYTDEKLTKPLEGFQRRAFIYMGDIQYLFLKSQAQTYKDGLFIHIRSKAKSTFMVEFESRMPKSAIELHEQVYEFTPVSKQQQLYLNLDQFTNSDTPLNEMEVSINEVKVFGNIGVEIRRCDSIEQCTGQNINNASQTIQYSIRQVGQKRSFEFKVKKQFWKTANIAKKSAIIVIVLSNLETKGISLAAIQFTVSNRPQFLRESTPVEAHIRKGSFKMFKYINSDPQIKKVRIFFTTLEGNSVFYVLRKKPSQNNFVNNSVLAKNSQIEISDDLADKPVIIIAAAKEESTVGIVIEPVKDIKQISSITLSENVEFKMRIEPNKYQIFEINPIQSGIYFKYSSTGLVHSCLLNDKNVCVSEKPILDNEGKIEVDNFKDRNALIAIRNPSTTRTIEVKAIFHSNRQKHCQLKKFGQLYSQVLQSGDCIKINVQKRDFEVFIARQQFGDLIYMVALCDKPLNYAINADGSERILVSKEQVSASCKEHIENVFYITAVTQTVETANKVDKNSSNEDQPKSLKLKYLFQYNEGNMTLPDGVAYHGKDVVTEGPLKIFTYDAINKINTTMILTSNSDLSYYAKIVETSDKDALKINKEQDADFRSSNDITYLFNSLIVKVQQKDFKKANCKLCSLLIYIYAGTNTQVGQTIEYDFEVTQNFAMLQEAKPRTNYLLKNSKDYYGYEAHKTGNLVIELSDNNKNCANLYLSDKEYADKKNKLVKAYDGQIIYQIKQIGDKGKYYITVEAKTDCKYSLSTSVSKYTNIKKLERGTLSFLNMKQKEVKYFTFRHFSAEAFKIMSLHKYGHVEMYINQTSPTQISKLLQQKEIKYLDFSYHSPHKNRLVMDSSDSLFCTQCFYILAVEAKKHTQSNIFLGDDKTSIPLSDDKIVNDIFAKKGDFTKGHFYSMDEGVVQIKVHSGSIAVEITRKDLKFNAQFDKKHQVITKNFSMKKQGFYGPSNIIFKALQDETMYSARVMHKDQVDDKNVEKKGTLISAGEPNFLWLTKGQQSCFRGFLKRRDERIIVSFDVLHQNQISELNFKANLDDKQTKLDKQIIRNTMGITFADALSKQKLTKALPFDVCVTSPNNSFSLTVVQSEEISLIPDNMEMPVSIRQSFAIRPEGNFLIDIFSCRGQAKLAYGHTKKDLQEKVPKALDVIGMPGQSHAKSISSYSSLFVKVEGPLSLVRWLPINEEKQKGLGYILYKAGKIHYDTGFNQIKLYIEPIKSTNKETKTQIQSIVYNLYISNSTEQLQEASLCERYFPKSVIHEKLAQLSTTDNEYNNLIDVSRQAKELRKTLQKSKLIKNYTNAKNLFVTVVADLHLLTPDNSTEQYRFVYANQQIPAQIFTPTKLETIRGNLDKNLILLILLVVFIIIAIIVFTYACGRFIIPLLGRLKNSNLVEEGPEDKSDKEKDEYIEAPKTSQRQGIHRQSEGVPHPVFESEDQA